MKIYDVKLECSRDIWHCATCLRRQWATLRYLLMEINTLNDYSLHCSSKALYRLSASLQPARRQADSFRPLTHRVPRVIGSRPGYPGKSLLTIRLKSTEILTCCGPILRRNYCDAKGPALHRKLRCDRLPVISIPG